MNRLLVSAFVACVAAAAPSVLWAQEQHEHHTPTGGEHATPSRGEHPSPMGGPSHSMSAPHTTSTYHNTMMHHEPGTTYHNTIMHHRPPHTTATHAVRERSHVRIDINTYHRNVTSARRFHFGDYRAPRGYAYRRWHYGERLPAIYFSQEYWIPNYLNFGLPYAPDDCEWVRFGPDAVLVDIDTGEVIEVEYDVFY